MSTRYLFIQKYIYKYWRKLFPIAGSAWTHGEIDDICKVHLTPPKQLEKFFKTALRTLQKIRENNVGSYLEFGIFNGNSLSCMWRAKEALGIDIIYSR